MKKTSILSFTLLFLLVLFFVPTKVKATNETVTVSFIDANLYKAIKDQISTKIISSDDAKKAITLTKSNLQNITVLNLNKKDIHYLSGIDKFANLQGLILSENQISSLYSLRTLTKLKFLNVSGNRLSSLATLYAFPNLASLYLQDNNISDITQIKNCPNLKLLEVSNNKIRDITPLASLTKLTHLYLSGNRVENAETLLSLKELKTVDLKNQKYEYSVKGNVLSNIATNVNLPTFFLQAKKNNYPHYTSSSFTVSGATLSNNSNYVILKDSGAGAKSYTIKINGGIADGSTATFTYNAVTVSVGSFTANPNPMYEGKGGTFSLIVTANGDTSTNDLSIKIIRNGIDVTGKFPFTKSNTTQNATKFTLTVPSSTQAGTYNLQVLYQNKIAATGSFTIQPPVIPESVSLGATSLTLNIGETHKFTATVLPTNAINKKVTFRE